jgi:hypothetical protein
MAEKYALATPQRFGDFLILEKIALATVVFDI